MSEWDANQTIESRELILHRGTVEHEIKSVRYWPENMLLPATFRAIGMNYLRRFVRYLRDGWEATSEERG